MWRSISEHAPVPSAALLLASALVACASRRPEPVPREPPMPLPDAVHGTDVGALLASHDAASVEAALEALVRADVTDWTPAARVLLQNDAWGLWQRSRAHGEAARALRRLAARAARHLALPADALAALAPAGAPLPSELAPREGWEEREAELPVLSHERAFGLRRLFRVLVAGPHGPAGPPRRALTSQLVALDVRGDAHVTRIAGELEQLRFEGDALVEARVHELDRAALLRGGHALRPAERVTRVPGRGANAFLFELDPPEPSSALPCARCHDDGTMMTLPTRRYPPGHRFPALLAQASDEGRALFADARGAVR